MTAPDPAAELDGLLRRAVRDLGDEYSCEVAVVLGPEYRWSMAAVGDDATALAALQFTLWDGPGPDVLAGGVPVVVDDLGAARGRWPLLVSGRGRLAVRSVAVLPLVIAAAPGTTQRSLIGLLTVTSRRAAAFDALDLRLWTAVARVAAVQAERATAWWSEAEVGGGPAGWQVSTAAGITAALDDVSPADALATLRARAFEAGRSLDDVAEEVVASVTRQGASPTARPGPPPAGHSGPTDLVLSVPIDRDGVDALAARVTAALGRHEGAELVVDVGRAGFVGRHALLALERCAGEHATPVVLRSASAETRRVAVILGLRWVRAEAATAAVR